MTDPFEGLNSEQRAVVEAVEGPVLVVAGAGSGKTTTLARRVAHLIRQGVAPESIMLLTFTRASARDMIERATRIEESARRVTSGTFHSVGMRLVRAHHAVLGLPPSPSVLDPSDVTEVLRRLSADKDRVQLESNKPRPATVAKAISYSSNTLIPLGEVVPDRWPDYSHAVDYMADLRDAYKRYKIERNLLDYDDILHAFASLAADEQVGPVLRRQYPFVMIDEHQDSNASQVEILYALGGEDGGASAGGGVMAVGDPAQAIYGFRGSAPATMFDFTRKWGGTRVFNLDTNYRSVPEILKVANAVDHAMTERFERDLRPVKPSEGTRPSIIRLPDPKEEASFLAQAVLAAKRDGIELKEQAILVRSVSTARMIEGELAARRIPYRLLGGVRIDEAKHVKDVVSMARVCVNPSDEPAWMRLLLLIPGVGEKKAAKVASDLLRLPTREGAASTLRAAGGKNQMALTLANALDLGFGAGSDAAEAIERLTGAMEPLLEHTYAEEWKQRKNDIEAVITMARGHGSLGDFLNVLTIDLSMDKKRHVLGGDAEEAPLTLSTVHSAKGLEWDVVFIPSFVQGHIPSMHADGYAQVQEELRIFYVATTRARKRLFLLKPAATMNGYLNADSAFESIVRPFCKLEGSASTNPYAPRGGRELSYDSGHRVAFRR